MLTSSHFSPLIFFPTGKDIRECISQCGLSATDSSDQFGSQSLVTFFENDDDKFLKSKTDNKYYPMFRRIDRCLSVERNPNGQIYLTHSLHKAGHFTSNTNYLKHNLFGQSFCLSPVETTTSDEQVPLKFPYCHVLLL